jgi:hypothetical protein
MSETMSGTSQQSETNYRCLSVVTGYHKCSAPPGVAYDAGLRRRFAIVLSSYRPDKDGMYFDADLFVRLLDGLLAVLLHDTLEIELPGDAVCLRSLDELSAIYAGCPEMERDPPSRMRIYNNGELVAIEDTEPWAYVGGPEPYHDSYTLSLYTAEDQSVAFWRVCEAVSKQSGARITGFHTAAPWKEPFVRWWKRPLRWVGLKPWSR